MSVQVEDLGKNLVKLTVEVAEDKVAEALKAAYEKQKSKISIPGFRKGKVPMNMIEKMYGAEVFYDEAINIMLQDSYGDAVDESGVDVVSRPKVEVTQMEKGKSFIYTAEVAKKPEVKLGQYKGVEVEKNDVTVTDDEVNEEIEKERNKNSRAITVERPVENGDTAIIDFEGFVDGEAFAGGKGTDYSLEIGSHSFIDTFEDQLIGKNTGDDVDVNVTFPEEYQEKSLAGKAALFKVKIKEVRAKELPELDDEYVSDISEAETVDAYKELVKQKISDRKTDIANNKKEADAVKAVIAGAEMDIPDAMVEMQAERLVEEFAQRINSQGLSFDQYVQFSGSSVEMLKEQVRPEALERIQSSLVLEQIAKDENITVSDEEVDEELTKMGAMYGMEADKLRELMGEKELETMKNDLAITKAAKFVADNAVEK